MNKKLITWMDKCIACIQFNYIISNLTVAVPIDLLVQTLQELLSRKAKIMDMYQCF